MRGLLSKPDSAWAAFLQGAGAGALAVGLPIVIETTFMAAKFGRVWQGLVISIGLSAVAAVLIGGANAGWRLLQLWAYDRFTRQSLD